MGSPSLQIYICDRQIIFLPYMHYKVMEEAEDNCNQYSYLERKKNRRHKAASGLSVQSLSCVQISVIPWTAACQASLSITKFRSLFKLMSIELVMPSSHLILLFLPWELPWEGDFLVIPFSSCPQFLPASGSFPISQLFTWGGQITGVPALASVPPMNTQDWSPLEWTGWISLQSKGLSRVFSNTTV